MRAMRDKRHMPKHYTIASTPEWKIEAISAIKKRKLELKEAVPAAAAGGVGAADGTAAAKDAEGKISKNIPKDMVAGVRVTQRRQLSPSSLVKLEELADQEVMLRGELETIRYVSQSLVWLLGKMTRYETQLNHDLVGPKDVSILPEPPTAPEQAKLTTAPGPPVSASSTPVVATGAVVSTAHVVSSSKRVDVAEAASSSSSSGAQAKETATVVAPSTATCPTAAAAAAPAPAPVLAAAPARPAPHISTPAAVVDASSSESAPPASAASISASTSPPSVVGASTATSEVKEIPKSEERVAAEMNVD